MCAEAKQAGCALFLGRCRAFETLHRCGCLSYTGDEKQRLVAQLVSVFAVCDRVNGNNATTRRTLP